MTGLSVVSDRDATQLVWRGTCRSADDTRAVGTVLAGVVAAGDVLVLTGPLGAGKTTLVQGLAAGLGVAAAVTSPTFVLAREMRGGRLPLIHVDAYRLASALELDDLDLDTDLTEAVVAVEWGEGLAEVLSPHRLEVRLERSAADEARTVEVRGVGDRWAGVVVASATAIPGPVVSQPVFSRDHGGTEQGDGGSAQFLHDHGGRGGRGVGGGG